MLTKKETNQIKCAIRLMHSPVTVEGYTCVYKQSVLEIINEFTQEKIKGKTDEKR